MRKSSVRSLLAGVLTLLLVSAVGDAFAGGFLLFEQGVKGLGNAFAGGAASAEDASTIFFNPAGMSLLPGSQVAAGVDYIMPKAKFHDEGSALSTSPIFTPVGPGPHPLTGGNGGDGGVSAPAPQLYYSQEITPKWHAGIGVNMPFGLATDYDEGWVGRYHALKSEVLTADINPSMSYEINRWFSIGAGVSAQYIHAKLTNAVDFAAIGVGGAVAAGGTPNPALVGILGSTDPTVRQSLDGNFDVTADDWGWGWDVGALIQPSDTFRIGLAYRSDVDYTLKGDADVDTPNATAAAIAGNAGLVDQGASADITLPGHASLSAYWRFHPKMAIMADVWWTHWSALDKLQIELDNGRTLTTTLDWRDTWRVALGFSYYTDMGLTWRLGAAWDQTPIRNDELRTPRIPGNDRIWTTAGLTYQITKSVGLDFAYAHLFVNDPKVNKTGTEQEDLFKGSLVGSYDASVDIVSLQVSAAF